MPQLIIDIPTSQAAQRIADAFTALYGYTGPDIAADKAEFVRQRLIIFMRDKVKEFDTRQAEQQARQQPEPGIE